MQAHAADPGVFIRSMATRGHLGGLARDHVGRGARARRGRQVVVIVETVGVGQDEVDIVRTADVSVVVLVPGTGDDVQALKAGIMEIADIFVVNKADRDGADRMVTSIESNLALQAYRRRRSGGRRSCKTEATTGKGVPELWRRDPRASAHTRPRDRTRRRPPGTSTGCASCWPGGSCAHVESRGAGAGRVRRRWSTASPRARSIPYTAAADVLAAGARIRRRAGVMKVRLDHIGIAVSDAAAAPAFYRDRRSGCSVAHAEDVASRSRCARTSCRPATAMLELLESHRARARRSRRSSTSAGPACTTSRSPSTTSTPRWRSCGAPACG